MWRSQTFENTYQGGYLLVVPRDLLLTWPGRNLQYDELCEFSPRAIDFLPIGVGFGVFVAGPDGDIAHEAWFVKPDVHGAVVLAAWNEWGEEDRDGWLTAQLEAAMLDWRRHDQLLEVTSGVLVLMHGEDAGNAVILAPNDRIAVGGERIEVAVEGGIYAIDTAEIEQRPDGDNSVQLCRFVRQVEV